MVGPLSNAFGVWGKGLRVLVRGGLRGVEERGEERALGTHWLSDDGCCELRCRCCQLCFLDLK